MKSSHTGWEIRAPDPSSHVRTTDELNVRRCRFDVRQTGGVVVRAGLGPLRCRRLRALFSWATLAHPSGEMDDFSLELQLLKRGSRNPQHQHLQTMLSQIHVVQIGQNHGQ